MLYNIIQIVAFQALFLLVYDLFLKKETFFNYNRAYLLITSLLSLVLPFIKFPQLTSVTTKDIVIRLPEVLIGQTPVTQLDLQIAEQAGIVINEPSTPIWQIVFVSGLIVALSLFLLKMARLFWLKETSPKRWKGNVLLVDLIKSSSAFSFFNTVFMGERIPTEEKTTIYNHELIHVKEFHSLDLLYFEVLKVVLWFNPMIYLYQYRIKELHEYIADAKAVKQKGKSSYYEALLNQVFDVNNISFTNTFFKKSLIKKRITMLQKTQSSKINLIKYALLIPLVLVMLIYTSTEVRAQQETRAQNEEVQELTEEQLIKKYYEEIIVLEKKGASFIDIADYAGMGKNSRDKYVISREQFLKSKAYMRYMAEQMIKRKSENGTLRDSDFDLAENMKLRSTYTEHRKWLKTQEAKEHWESYARDGELRFVVDDLANKTDTEQKRFDALLKQLTDDENFNRLIVCEVKSATRLDLNSDDGVENDTQIPVEENTIEVPFAVIDEVPTTMECSGLSTNAERKQCMSQFVAKHVNKNFNIGLADSLGITGRQRIFVSFKIDKKGLLKDVRARASKKELEIEAVRVIKTLPQFIPGRQKGKAVIVPYSLPIVFQINGDGNNSKEEQYDKELDSIKIEAIGKLEELREQRNRLMQNTSEENPVVAQLNRQIDSLRISIMKSVLENKLEYTDSVKKDTLSKVPFSVVDVSPTHPECKELVGNDERKKCTSAVVAKFVNSKFNTKLASTLDLPNGRQRILGAFTIDKEGYVTKVKVRGPHPKLEEETERVLKLLPQFIPGEHKGEKVEVPYSLPIIFQLANNKKKKN